MFSHGVFYDRNAGCMQVVDVVHSSVDADNDSDIL